MKKHLLIFFFLLFSAKIFAQQFSQYNTGTLYDSFENPSQRVFTSDTSKMFAFNFFAPNFNLNFYLTGDAQAAVRSRVFSNYYNTAALQVGKGRYNHINANANAYLVMFKVFASPNGDQELGFSINTKAESRGFVSDESISLFNGPSDFPNNSYSNILNDNYYYQVYQQIGFTYREQITKQFALGLKLSALSGVAYDELNITQSQIDFDKPNDAVNIQLAGRNYVSNNNGKSYLQNLIPTFHNPGASISIGASFKTEDGFIHWAKSSTIFVFNSFGSPITVNGLSTPQREDSIYNKAHFISTTSPKTTDFATPTNGLAEISVNRSYWIDYDKQIKFSPTLIASKELFYTGFTAALVTPVQFNKYVATLISSYNDRKLFNFGAQFMIKKEDFEFFIGSERLFQTGSLLISALKKASAPVLSYSTPPSFTGADFFIGFSMKFGPVVEHNMNSSRVSSGGEKGFLGKLFDRVFPKDPIRNN
jgi:hypothetical protein